jgi:uncharacterized membrane protein
MPELVSILLTHLHPSLIHFPIALLFVSVALDMLARRASAMQRSLRFSRWLSLLLGSVATLPAVLTGLIAHLPYEQSPLIDVIEVHQYLGFGTTLLFGALTGWRWRTRRQQRDAAASWLYVGVAVVGLAVLVLTGMTGGNVVYQYGIGVAHNTP